MSAEIYVVSITKNEDDFSTRSSTCGIFLIHTDKSNRISKRDFAFRLFGSTHVLSDIQACRLALSSIANFRSDKVVIYVDNVKLASILASDVKVDECPSELTDLKRILESYSDVSVSAVAGNNSNMNRANKLANDLFNSNIDYDSGTYYV